MMFLANSNNKSSGNTTSNNSSGTSWWGGNNNDSKTSPIDQAKKWKRELDKQVRGMDRDIQNIQRSEQKSIKECKALAKAGRTSAVKILAKEIANTRRTVARMYQCKAQLNSVASSLQTSISMMKLQGCMIKSAEIMTSMNKLVNIKEINESMSTMAREMERAGLVDEIIGDALESLEPEGLDAEADAEVDRIITELTSDILSPAGSLNTKASSAIINKTATSVTTEEQAPGIEENSTEDLLSRLQAL